MDPTSGRAAEQADELTAKSGVSTRAHSERVPCEPGATTFDLFVVYAEADSEFVSGYLLPALQLPKERVILIDELTPGAPTVDEIAAATLRSRFTVVVLSPSFLTDRWAVFGEQLASYLSVNVVRLIPLLLHTCDVPLHLRFRVVVDFRDKAHWQARAARLKEQLQTIGPADPPLAPPAPDPAFLALVLEFLRRQLLHRRRVVTLAACSAVITAIALYPRWRGPRSVDVTVEGDVVDESGAAMQAVEVHADGFGDDATVKTDGHGHMMLKFKGVKRDQPVNLSFLFPSYETTPVTAYLEPPVVKLAPVYLHRVR